MEMNIFDLFGSIKIISTPSGEAPEKIRDAWIGVEMPCVYYLEKGSESFGIFSQQQTETSSVYVVAQIQAIGALEEVSPEAAKWWNDHGFPKSDEALFSFKKNEVEELKKVLSEEEFLQEMEKILNKTM